MHRILMFFQSSNQSLDYIDLWLTFIPTTDLSCSFKVVIGVIDIVLYFQYPWAVVGCSALD